MKKRSDFETTTFAGGCFWCTEAVFKRLPGVLALSPGYSGGKKANPSYEEVCSGVTGHAEAIQINFNPNLVSYEKLLRVFFATHDPTSLNRQGNDVGTQYRSVIFYHTKNQKNQAEDYIKKLTYKKAYTNPIVTQVVPFKTFYEAEEYHKNYFERNKSAPYCQLVIAPKLEKLTSLLAEMS